MNDNKQRLVLSIIDFLNQSIVDGTVKSDDKESLEVAIQCIGEAFGVDPADDTQVKKLSVKPATLPSIFDVFLKTKDKVGTTATPAASTSSTSKRSGSDNTKADDYKANGNKLMSEKKYDQAIDAYTQAISLDPTNAVYYSNRAAAYSSKGDHLAAVGDAEQAIATDPKFVKGYHRLGHAQFCLEDYEAAAEAFERGLKLEPGNQGLKSSLENAKSRIVPSSSTGASSATPRGGGGGGGGGLADLLSGLGGGAGGGGGMPDLASLMSNPQMMSMAQQMMANGGLENLMRNPNVANMMNRVQSGDMPSMAELMDDPSLRDLAQQYGGDQIKLCKELLVMGD
ncbi:Hsc70 cochaperone [Mycena indigotica]|uniref:Hsc70 cochaperone n=1 Tax=Mycena indigotica TaxID=2126181 RepID=A0A8H6SVA7_9AGAR|nr:Hsc70 cochaperone [Mycena indigotica]KAF7306553.1 Hsc70 cochaperone [Mycena indigotica]